MNNKQKCFISYSKNDCDLDTIKSMIDYLERCSKYSIDFLIDENLKIGKDFNKFMKLVKTVDAIIVLLTPEYKKKADEKINSGVYTEYKMILERLEEDQKCKQDGFDCLDSQSTFCFIPIIFSHEHDKSCPESIKQYKALNFSTLQFVGNKLINSIESEYNKQFRKICSDISAIRSINSESVRKEYEQKLHGLLFSETKQDNIMHKPIAQNKELYVKTRPFNDLRTQQAYIFLGRKGCGKSTLGPLLFLFENAKYKEHIEVNVDRIDLGYTIDMVFTPALQSELCVVIKIPVFFKLVWNVLFLYKCCEVLVNEDQNDGLPDHQKKNVVTIKEFLDNVKSSTKREPFWCEFEDNQTGKNNNPIFQWSVSSVAKCVEKAIQNSNDKEENFHYELHSLLRMNNVLLEIFSETVLKSIYSIFGEGKISILVSFDGFDNLFETFRRDTINRSFDEKTKSFRKDIEAGFLEGFLNLAMDIKSNQKDDAVYKNIDMCVTVPKDRFFEIKGLQRDSYRYINLFREIKWTGIELSIMLRKRLEILYNNQYLSKKEDTPQNRLISVIKNLPILKTIPLMTEVSINNNSYKIDTFLNVLRHSFGRPREILIYYSKLIVIARDFIKRKKTIDSFTVSKIISETTFDIIREEFISEFKNYCINIKDILNIFKKSKQILSRTELENKLGIIVFEFINGDVKDFKSKIEFLFEIGFIGIEVSKEQMDRYYLLISDIFNFNTDNRAFEVLQGDDFDGCNFIIHPIFCEFLGLDLSNQNRPVLNISWKYLVNQDLHMLKI